MAFSRDDLKEYEGQKQEDVPLFDAVKGPAAEKSDEPADDSTTADADTPSGDVETETLPDDSGDGTSDENDATADSSTADSASPDGDSTESSDADGEQPPRKGSARARIQELVDEVHNYRSYGEYAQEQLRAKDQALAEKAKALAEAEAKLKTGSSTTAPAATAEPPVPTLEDPDVNYDPEKFSQKLGKWRDEVKAIAEKNAKAAVTPAEQPHPKVVAFMGRIEEFKKTHPDFEKRATLLPQLSPTAGRAVIEHERGPDILDYLSHRLGDAVRIAKLSDELQALEIGRILDRIESQKGKTVIPPKNQTPTPDASKTPAKPKSQSNAPPPLTAVRGGGRRDELPITDPSISMDEFVRRERAKKIAAHEYSRKARGLR